MLSAKLLKHQPLYPSPCPLPEGEGSLSTALGSQPPDFTIPSALNSPSATPSSAAGLPLVAGDADRILAIRSDGVVSAGEFLVQARALASRLPESPFVINLFESRYRFALGFVAAMLRGQITLLPSNRAPKALERVESLYPGAYRLNDPEVADLETVGWAGSICPPNDLRGSNDSLGNAALMPNLQAGRELSESGFTIPADRTVAIVFTSGSTGDPQPHLKTWGIYCHSARLIAESLGIKRFAADALVATVPPQHMYGLE